MTTRLDALAEVVQAGLEHLGLSMREYPGEFELRDRDCTLFRSQYEEDEKLAPVRAAVPVDVVAAVRIHPDGRVWLCRRNDDGDNAGLKGMWEYPGGKVEPDEQLRDALMRELREEFPDIRAIMLGRVLDSITSVYGDTAYRVTFFEVMMSGEPKETPCHSEVRWMTKDEACSVEHLPSGTIFNARHLSRGL